MIYIKKISQVTALSFLAFFKISCFQHAAKVKDTSLGGVSIGLPKPSGSYQIGIKKYYFNDPKREDPFMPGSSRELIVNVYYPAEPSITAQKAPYLDLKDQALAFYNDVLSKEGYDLSPLRRVVSNIFKEPLIAKQRKTYPLVVLSPGSGIPPEFYSIFISELVSHGWIVAAINHTYISVISQFPDGSIRKNDSSNQLRRNLHFNGEDAQGKVVEIVANDISQVIEKLKEIDLSRHIDFSKMTMIGHSLGGMAVTYLCPNLQSCRAGINLDGPLLGAPSSVLRAGNLTGDLTKPFLFFAGKMIVNLPKSKDAFLERKDLLETISKLDGIWSAEEFYTYQIDRFRGRLVRAANKMGKHSSIVVLKDANHLSFSDWALLEASLSLKAVDVSQKRFLVIINQIIRNFLESSINKTRGRKNLMDGVNGVNDIEIGLKE